MKGLAGRTASHDGRSKLAMKLLILGGTRFLGRAIVEAAMAKGNEITLFHRGQTNPDLFPEAEHILGDRDGDLNGLAGGRWDAVIDTCGYVPRIVEQSVRFLAPHVVRPALPSIYCARTSWSAACSACLGDGTGKPQNLATRRPPRS